MTLFYFDTSAILKRYKDEKGSELVRELIELEKPDEVFVSSLVSAVEVFSVASRMLKGRIISQKEHDSLTARFVSDFASRFEVAAVDNSLLISSIALALKHKLRTVDTIHLATIVQMRAVVTGGEQLLVVTSDREMIGACLAEGIEVIDPEADGATETLRNLRR